MSTQLQTPGYKSHSRWGTDATDRWGCEHADLSVGNVRDYG